MENKTSKNKEGQKWLSLGRVWEIKPGELARFEIGRFVIALANVDGEFFAFNDRCPHEDFPLSDGVLEGCKIACAIHGWSFDLKTGRPFPPLLRPYLKLYPTLVENDFIKVCLE